MAGTTRALWKLPLSRNFSDNAATCSSALGKLSWFSSTGVTEPLAKNGVDEPEVSLPVPCPLLHNPEETNQNQEARAGWKELYTSFKISLFGFATRDR